MIDSLLRLFAVRPVLTMAILGIPVIVLIGIGLATVFVVKFVLLPVLLIILAIWIIRKLFRRNTA